MAFILPHNSYISTLMCVLEQGFYPLIKNRFHKLYIRLTLVNWAGSTFKQLDLATGHPFLACGDSGHMRGSGVGTGRGSHLGMETAARFSLNHLYTCPSLS